MVAQYSSRSSKECLCAQTVYYSSCCGGHLQVRPVEVDVSSISCSVCVDVGRRHVSALALTASVCPTGKSL